MEWSYSNQPFVLHPGSSWQYCFDACVIIPNYNGSSFLLDTLSKTSNAIAQSSLHCEIILVDNGSDDNSAETIREYLKEVRILSLPKKVGFAAANNAGARAAAPAEVLLFLNSDAWLCPGTLESLVAFLRNNKDFGAVAPIEKAPDGRIRRTWWNCPTPARIVVGLLGDMLWRQWFPAKTEFDPSSKEWENTCRKKQVIEAPYLPGFCVLIRSSVFHRIGGWDEHYPLYSEDVDLGYRVAREGLKQGIVTNALAYHIGAASSTVMTVEEKARRLWAAKALFCHKHFRNGARALRLFAHFARRLIPHQAVGLHIALEQLASIPQVASMKSTPLAIDARSRHTSAGTMHEKVSVVIPSFNRTEGLQQVLPSYLQASDVGEVVVVLDGVMDVPAELREVDWPYTVKPRFIVAGSRIGQPASRMLGARAAKHNLVLFGEDDVTLEPDYVRRLLETFHAEEATIVAGRIIGVPWSASKSWARTAADWHVGYAVDRNAIEADFSRLCPGQHEVPFLHSVALMPREVVISVGFDAEYYRGNQYREETDFYVRALARGYRLVWDNDAVCYHHRGGPFEKGGQRCSRLSFLVWTIVNTHLFLVKNRSILKMALGIRHPYLASTTYALRNIKNFLRSTASKWIPVSLRTNWNETIFEPESQE